MSANYCVCLQLCWSSPRLTLLAPEEERNTLSSYSWHIWSVPDSSFFSSPLFPLQSPQFPYSSPHIEMNVQNNNNRLSVMILRFFGIKAFLLVLTLLPGLLTTEIHNFTTVKEHKWFGSHTSFAMDWVLFHVVNSTRNRVMAYGLPVNFFTKCLAPQRSKRNM